MGKVTTGATISLDGFIADASHGSFDYLFKWYRGRRCRGPCGPPGHDVQGLRRQRGAPAAAERAPRRVGGGPPPVRHDQRLGRPPPARPHDRGSHPPAAQRPARGRRELRLRHHRHRRRGGQGRGDRQRQGRWHQRGRDRPPVFRRGADGRGARSTSSTREGSGRRATADRGAAGPAVLGCHQLSAIGGLVKRP